MTNAALAGADSRRWRALTVSLVAAGMVLLDVSIVNVALPSVEREFGVSAGTVQWVVSGYALTFGLALVPAGRLGDTVGRRRMFLVALTAFVLTSALTGAARSTGWLIAARLLQGVAGGMLVPQNSGLVQDLFSGGERGRAFGLLGGVVGLSTATGPVIGGLILALATGPDGWRWVFYVNVPVGLLALVLATRWLPAGRRTDAGGARLDVVGALLPRPPLSFAGARREPGGDRARAGGDRSKPNGRSRICRACRDRADLGPGAPVENERRSLRDRRWARNQASR